MIIAFANQKGGVGKSTLCAAFAMYLHQQQMEVTVLDCDYQQTIVSRRQMELSAGFGKEPPYRVLPFRLTEADQATDLAGAMREYDGGVLLLDLPGTLELAGVMTVILASDVAVIPFNMEPVSVVSTVQFCHVLNGTRKQQDKPVKMIMAPNRMERGNRQETKIWADTLTFMRNTYGPIMPEIRKRMEITRFSTCRFSKRVFEPMFVCFDALYREIFGAEPPVVYIQPHRPAADDSQPALFDQSVQPS